METRFVDLSLVSEFWLVALWIDWVESVDLVLTFSVAVSLPHQRNRPQSHV